MTTRPIGPDEHKDEADTVTLQAILEAVMVRNQAFDNLFEVLQQNNAELRKTQNLLGTRPTKEDVAYHRRKGTAVAILFAFLFIFGLDEHVERCSPGVEAKAVVEAITEEGRTEPLTREEFIDITEEATPGYCTMTFPFHVHDDKEPWPNERALFGMSIYGLGAAGLVAWVLVAYRRKVRVEAAEEAAQPRDRRSGDRDTTDPS